MVLFGSCIILATSFYVAICKLCAVAGENANFILDNHNHHSTTNSGSQDVVYSRNKKAILKQILGRKSNSIQNDENEMKILEDFLNSRGKIFQYHEPIEISSVDPSSSPTKGNVSVTIFGGPFLSSLQPGDLCCKFGRVSVPGLFVSSSQIQCNTPPHAAGSYPLEITQNGQDYTQSRYSFRFYHECTFHSIYPVTGPAMMGGTNVRILGEGFIESTSLYCRFGEAEVPATFVDSSEIYCSAPPIKEEGLSWLVLPDQRHNGTVLEDQMLLPMSHQYPQYLGKLVNVEVTNNGQDYTSSGFKFLYQKDIQVMKLSRASGPSHGGTPVFISGSSFVNSTELTCKFGGETARAIFLTREAILCTSPPIPAHSFHTSQEKIVIIYVSNNAVDYSVGGHFKYSHSLPSGTYQPGAEDVDTLLRCPRGTYCSSDSFRNFTLCTPGTYQPLVGQSQCILCPIGYVCSEFGMAVPRICPAGYVCDDTGMYKGKPCPAGHWCDKGTATISSSCLNHGILDASYSSLDTCFDNSTDDFGLQASNLPAQIWAERHLMPLDSDSTIQPIRGKFCLEESCLKYEDENDFGVFDKSFDYSSTGFALRRPHPCPQGVYCHPGTPTNMTISAGWASPVKCRDGIHCPVGSAFPNGIGSCKRGHYCRFGIRKPCPVGTYCPNEYTFEPLPCEPGTFNLMIGQAECSVCPVGYMCPSYGLRDPVICPPGMVCSRKGLASPNIRCPAGFYCPNGTQTSDPFRNDTTLRPYACTPGTYCLAGTGSNEVVEGEVGHAQFCAKGFFCEAASVSAKGSGPCPPGFICEKGTANPRPTPKGFFAEHSGTIEATACLPGFYAPTIENKECYPCPPGTSCSLEGLYEAEECPPGTYRSDPEIDGFGSCIPCPQGTWSKNWQLREKGECTRCPTGVVCPIDGMTSPCSFDDLPQPFEPVVNFKGMPAFEYEFPIETMPQPFTLDECLALNSKSKHTDKQEFFYGELVPPYIDILGRGPHFRESDDLSIKYQSTAKCYRNAQPDGSLLYMRMADYYGPQYDIQTGFFHQGYGSSFLLNQMYAVSPPKGFDVRLTYYRGKGNGFIDLPKSRRFEPAFNCTKGFKLFNSTLVRHDVKRVVYTHPLHDYEGGYDIEKCPTFDPQLNCYIDATFELHLPGECCNVEKFRQRAILLAADQFYHGTCESDKICAEGRSSEPEAKPCDDSFICDEGTSLENSLKYPCPAGFICGFGTTPDTKLEAPSGQLSHLCDEGRYCNRMISEIGNEACPRNYFCPTGTADPFEGRLANDGLLRMLPSPFSDESIHLRYLHGENFGFYCDHEMKCAASTIPSLKKRFQTGWKLPDETDSTPEYLTRQQRPFSISMNEATQLEATCERDKKSHFIQQAINRNDCNCHSKFLILAAIYRLWKCTASNPLDDLGLGEPTVPSMGNGKRDFWYSDSRVHLDRQSATAMDPSMEPFGLNWGEGKVCKFLPSNDKITLTRGRIPHAQDSPIHARGIPFESKGYLEFEDVAGTENVDVRFPIRFTWQSFRVFANYVELKASAVHEFKRERDAVAAGNRSNIDPFVFDIFKSIQLIEQYGEKLEQFAFLEATNTSSSLSIELSYVDANNSSALYALAGRLDWCECENILKCPNGTATSGVGAKGMNDCVSTNEEVLHRISLIPPPPDEIAKPMSTGEGSIDTESARLVLKPFETGILTVDLSMLPNNITYNDHYRISIYDGCQPCPLRYKCNAGNGHQSKKCFNPPLERQYELLNGCLKKNRKVVCLRDDGTHEDIQKCKSGTNNSSSSGSSGSLLLFSEPDLEKCLSHPYFCSDTEWNYRTYRRLCQGNSAISGETEIYDCSLVHRWNTYAHWKNNVCCSEISELSGFDSCRKNECVDDPRIDDIIRGKLIDVFEREYGFIPPIRKPSGKLLMNATLQEALDHESPLDLFHEWREQFPESSKLMQEVTLHHPKKPHLSHPYKITSGCCDCKRHAMPTFFETNNPTSSGYPDNKHGHVQITVTAIATVELYIAVELLHGAYYLDFETYFGSRDKSTLRIHAPQKFSEISEPATWLTVLEKSAFEKWDLELPLNLPVRVNEGGRKGIEDRFFVNIPRNKTIANRILAKEIIFELADYEDDGKSRPPLPSVRDPIESIRLNDEWWGQKHDFIALPYIPFFSNCDGYDSHVFLGRLLEDHPDCLSVPPNEVESTNDFSFTRKEPYSDRCQDLILQCTYEEEIRDSSEKFRWFEVSSGSNLFHITRDAVTIDAFVPSNEAEDWGRTVFLDQLRNSYDLIPVSIGDGMGGFLNAIPRVVELELKYYQISSGTKRLVEAAIYFHDLCTTQKQDYFGGSVKILNDMKERGILPCQSDINGDIKSDNYELIIQYFPLGWFDLLNRFEFGGPVYFFFYTAIGLTICLIGGSVYGINRLLTEFRHPPPFQGWQLVALVSRPQIEGVILAVIPYMVVVSTIHTLFRHDGVLEFDSLHKNWMSSGSIGDDEGVENAMGRMGSAFLVLGSYITLKGSSSIIISDETSKKHLVVAKRAHFIWASLCLQAMILCLLEFSYSDSYKNDIFRFVVIFKFGQIAFDVILSHVIRDKLLIAPLLVLIQMSEILVTIGARDFVEFTLSFLVKISLIVVQRLFIYPFIHTILTLLPRWNLLARHCFGRKSFTRKEKKQREARWKKVNENIELQTEGVEPLVDSITIFSVEKTGGILLPFMCLFLMLLYRETEIAMNYNISQHELFYYGSFAFYMIIWTCIVDTFILSSQELLYGWRVYDYLSYTRWRFSNRENRWNLFGKFDESLSYSYQSIDLLCFSSQYYFILTLLTLGFGSNIFAITICLRRKYNFLADPVFPIVAFVVVLCCEVVTVSCKYLANTSVPAICWRGIWQVSRVQSTMDDMIAAKLAVGEGRQEDLEQERQELLALNSETFRQNFLEKNRPWILQHLVELITPRTLQGVGADERPLADYLRGVYSNLMNTSTATKRAGDRTDISSDTSDDEFEKRRRWDRNPLEGNQVTIAKVWLKKARKRGIFTKAVMPSIERRKEDHCSACSRTLGSCKTLHAGLAQNGRYDSYAIDGLIKEFEQKYSPHESDPTLWKAFFREKAHFMTICNICLDQVEQQKLHKDVRHVGAGRLTRPGDISSDDESDEEEAFFFEPISVPRSSKAGAMMSKWLQACRQRLGGEFPRNGSQQSTEQYLNMLRVRKLRKSKTFLRDEPVTGWGSVSTSKEGKKIMTKWLNNARVRSNERFALKGLEIRRSLETTLKEISLESDWYFGDLRLEGKALQLEGSHLMKMKESNEKAIESDLDLSRKTLNNLTNDLETKRRSKQSDFNEKVAKLRNESQRKKDERVRQLQKAIHESRSDETSASLRKQILSYIEEEDKATAKKEEEMSADLEECMALIDRDIVHARRKFHVDSESTRERLIREWKHEEVLYRHKCSVWIGISSRKVENFKSGRSKK